MPLDRHVKSAGVSAGLCPPALQTPFSGPGCRTTCDLSWFFSICKGESAQNSPTKSPWMYHHNMRSLLGACCMGGGQEWSRAVTAAAPPCLGLNEQIMPVAVCKFPERNIQGNEHQHCSRNGAPTVPGGGRGARLEVEAADHDGEGAREQRGGHDGRQPVPQPPPPRREVQLRLSRHRRRPPLACMHAPALAGGRGTALCSPGLSRMPGEQRGRQGWADILDQ